MEPGIKSDERSRTDVRLSIGSAAPFPGVGAVDDGEVTDTLNAIPELGFVSIRDGRVLNAVEPICSVYANVPGFESSRRWAPTLDYLARYAGANVHFGGEFFLCTYDGWREFSPFVPEGRRVRVRWTGDMRLEYASATGNAGEPRFAHRGPDVALYPELCRKVMTYDRHRGDASCVLIPDAHFLQGMYDDFFGDVVLHDVPWDAKPHGDSLFWRGSRNVALNLPSGTGCIGGLHAHSVGPVYAHARDVAVDLSTHRRGSEIDAGTRGDGPFASGLDASFNRCTVGEQLKHRFLLSMDGMVNAWTGTAWKLRSNSTCVILDSGWEHWYSGETLPDEHYARLETLYDAPMVLAWLRGDPGRARWIADRGAQLSRRVHRYEYAVHEYRIR